MKKILLLLTLILAGLTIQNLAAKGCRTVRFEEGECTIFITICDGVERNRHKSCPDQ